MNEADENDVNVQRILIYSLAGSFPVLLLLSHIHTHTDTDTVVNDEQIPKLAAPGQHVSMPCFRRKTKSRAPFIFA